jgi:ankyrin repeat protein
MKKLNILFVVFGLLSIGSLQADAFSNLVAAIKNSSINQSNINTVNSIISNEELTNKSGMKTFVNTKIAGKTPLIYAVEKRDLAAVQALLKISGIDVNTTGPQSNTPLIYAANSGDLAIVQALLKVSGISVNTKGDKSYTALMIMFENQYTVNAVPIIQALVQAGGTISVGPASFWDTQLNLDANKAKVAILSQYDANALFLFALRNGNETLAASILSGEGASHVDPNSFVSVSVNGQTVKAPILSYAILSGDLSIVQALLKIPGINVNALDTTYHQTPLMWTQHGKVQATNAQMAQALFNAKYLSPALNINMLSSGTAASTDYAASVLAYAVSASSPNLPFIQSLVKAGANINEQDSNGMTPLLLSIKNKNSTVIKYLLAEPQIDFTVVDINGQNAYYLAKSLKNTALVGDIQKAAQNQLFVSALLGTGSEQIAGLVGSGADINQRLTASVYGIYQEGQWSEMLKDSNINNEFFNFTYFPLIGMTPLMIAASSSSQNSSQYLPVVKAILTQSNANVNAQLGADKKGSIDTSGNTLTGQLQNGGQKTLVQACIDSSCKSGTKSFGVSSILNTALIYACLSGNQPIIKEIAQSAQSLQSSSALWDQVSYFRQKGWIKGEITETLTSSTGKSVTKEVTSMNGTNWVNMWASLVGVPLSKTTLDVINSSVSNQAGDLLTACYQGNTQVAERYVTNSNVNIPDGKTKMTPLMYALNGLYPNIELVNLLLGKGANVNMTSADKATPLIYAVSGTQAISYPIVKALLSKGAKSTINTVNKYGGSALSYSVGNENSSLNIIELLLENGASATGSKGSYTPLMNAAQGSINASYITALLNKGAKSSINWVETGKYEGTALTYAIASKKANIPVISTLIKGGAKVDQVLKNNRTPLAYALDQKSPNVSIVNYLLNNGVGSTINLVGSEGSTYPEWTPLSLAITAPKSALELTTLILSKLDPHNLDSGVNQTFRFYDKATKKNITATALLAAVMLPKPSLSIIQVLLAKGADVNQAGLGEDIKTYVNVAKYKTANPTITAAINKAVKAAAAK